MEQEQWNTFLRSNFSQMDSNSQQLLFHSYRNLIYRDIYFLFRNHELAEDIVQESFLKVVAKAPKLTNTTNMKAWIKKKWPATSHTTTSRRIKKILPNLRA